MTKYLTCMSVVLLMLGADFVYAADAGSGPPKVAEASFEPTQPVTGVPVKLRIKLEGAAIRAEVKWSINDQEAENADYDGLGKPVELHKKATFGDKVTASVTPFDAIGSAGRVVTKEVTIGNAPPVVKVGDQKVTGNTYTVHIEATDPEGGPVTFNVNQGPEGLSIDPRGDVTWKISEAISGSFPVAIAVVDDKGAQTVANFTINLRWQKGK
ncbi:MAG TPA: putative Ig domain-containing protein [Desulfomonilaceae bacterium]|nr:putative Ig domain-containing protein [Desulfomonilaceae bacterium]